MESIQEWRKMNVTNFTVVIRRQRTTLLYGTANYTLFVFRRDFSHLGRVYAKLFLLVLPAKHSSHKMSVEFLCHSLFVQLSFENGSAP